MLFRSGKNTGSGLPCPPPGDLLNSGVKPRSPALQEDSLLSEPPGNPVNTGVGGLSLLQKNFLMQESNQDLLCCRQILYQLSYQGSPPISNFTHLPPTWVRMTAMDVSQQRGWTLLAGEGAGRPGSESSSAMDTPYPWARHPQMRKPRHSDSRKAATLGLTQIFPALEHHAILRPSGGKGEPRTWQVHPWCPQSCYCV